MNEEIPDMLVVEEVPGPFPSFAELMATIRYPFVWTTEKANEETKMVETGSHPDMVADPELSEAFEEFVNAGRNDADDSTR